MKNPSFVLRVCLRFLREQNFIHIKDTDVGFGFLSSMWIFLLSLVVVATDGWGLWGYNSNCVYTRADAVGCFARHIDTNHDGVISKEEVDAAREKYAGGFLFRTIQRLSSWVIDIRTEKILADCDYDHDGRFTPDDWMRSYKTCVASQWGLCVIKKFCDAADAETAQPEVMKDVKPPRSWRDWL